ncbi:MAG: type 2 isopentenyl-diphosphate Delta-isomerase [Candidatus Diapherotrites archaeon]|nr:type 2 isopentenyl-diphosphate Delta-isomerase [Candidatus Diapherotrites archaeon]
MSLVKKRKLEHLDICAKQDVEEGSTWLEHVRFVHNSLTSVNLNEVDTKTKLLGKELRAPLVISAMTGGVDEAGKINKELASVAEELGIGFGVGSQRAMIETPELWKTYYVRDEAPSTLILGNIGAVNNYTTNQVEDTMKKIKADAMCIHLNPAQELAQPEGDVDFSGCLKNIKEAAKALPVVAKETGNGLSKENALLLKSAGVKAIDVGGYGGTSWVKVEKLRNGASHTPIDWGIPTAASIIECQVGLPIIATGGIRSGLDVAKAIALGADAAGVALPVLRWYYEGGKVRVKENLEEWIKELKDVMVLTNSSNIAELKRTDIVVSGPLLEWCNERGVKQRKHI